MRTRPGVLAHCLGEMIQDPESFDGRAALLYLAETVVILHRTLTPKKT